MNQDRPPETTLARLSFWVSAAHLPEFEAAYASRLVPILKKHGLVKSAERGRPTAEGIFSRLFEVEGPAAIVEKRQALLADPDWQRAVQELDTALGTLGKGFQRGLQTAGFYFSPYQTPAGPGTTVPAGPGRQVAAGRGRGHWRTFDATDGLPGGTIRAILQDREGYLWIGSWGGGLSRYDGHRFQPFTPQEGLASRLVQSVIEDQAGNLWIGTLDQGLFRYDGQRFEHFTIRDGLVADEVMRVFEDREGHIWVGTLKGLSRYDGHRFENFTAQDGLPGDLVEAIFQDREGYLWFGTGELGGEGHRGGVSRYDGHGFQTFTTEEGLAFDAVWSILQDREGIFWFGTDGGLSRYDGHRFQTFTTEEGLGANNVWSILQDQEGALWFGTKGGGVSRYDGRTFTTFTTQDGLASNFLQTIFQDWEGSLWFGTSGGLSRYDSQLSTTFTVEDGLADDEVLALLQDREGVFWFGTPGGLSRYEGRTFTTFTAQDGLADNRVHRILQDQAGNLWFIHSGNQASGKGVTRYDGHRFTVFTVQDGLGSDWVTAIFQGQAGDLWFGYGDGASRCDGAQFEYLATADGLIAGGGEGSIFQDQEGVLWFGSGMGLSRYDGHTFTTQNGLADKWVTSISQAQGGGLWLGIWGGGVLWYDGQSFKSFTTRDGLADDSVESMLCDLQGRLWIGTPSGGVSLYDGQAFQTFTTQDGLGANNVLSILQDREGNLWFGTTKGVTRYRPPPLSSPPMYIDAVVADRRYEGMAEVEIPAAVKLIAFEFHGMSFKTRPEAMVYRYRLEGYEEEWRNTHSRRVEYQDLPLGEYTFEVRAVDRDLNYSAPAAVRVRVAPDPQLEALTQALSGGADRFVGRSPALQHVQAQLAQVAPTDLTVMILGETGTGKGLAARTVHQLSQRRSGPFLQVNCGGIPPGLLESELFGHERGAFTGAVARKLGKVELAHGGTLFLDEIGDLPAEGQAKLLRLLEERTFERVGGTRTLSAQVRVIAATNRDLAGMVAAGQFRQDLYYRLEGFTVWLPPLRQRREDIPELALFFAGRMAAHLDKGIEGFEPATLALLQDYPWPGNVRELEHAVQRAVIVAAGPRLRAADLALRVEPPQESPLEEFGLSPEEYERRYLARVLAQTGWVIKGPRGAAARLGISPSTLHDRLKKLGIVRSEGR